MKPFYGFLLLVMCGDVCFAQQESNNPNLMQRGGQLSQIADRLEQSARDTIKQANQQRQHVIQLRQQEKQQAQQDPKFTLVINNKLDAAKSLQEAAPLIRNQAERVRLQALDYLSRGMQLRYSKWINNSGPISMSADGAKSHDGTMAHNTRISSAKPELQELRQAMSMSRNEGMTLELSNSLSQDLPEEIDTSSFVLSRERLYFAHIELEESGVDSGVILNQIQSWRLILTELNGAPVSDAIVKFDGHMPGHVHGLPTQPLLTKEVAPGIYQISGVKFQMAGWWVIELELGITNNDGSQEVVDSLRFNLAL